MKTTAQLIQSNNGGWNIRYITGPRAELIRSLFGTDILPLPYGGMALPQAIAEFRANTAGVVSIAEDGYVLLS